MFAQDTEQELNELNQQLEQIRTTSGISAAVVLIVDKDKVLLQSHLGRANWDTDKPLPQDSIFRIGSISKSFAGLLALRMQEDDLIDLNKPLTDYLDKSYIQNTFHSNGIPSAQITLAQLLEHTAGLSDLSQAEWDYQNTKNLSLENALALKLGAHRTLWSPGLHSSYTNVGVGILGLALEKAAGKSYETLMHDFVFEPLNMKSSNLLLSSAVKEKLITGYNTDGKTPIDYWHNIYRPFAAVNTNSNDMVNFLQLLLNEGAHKGETLLNEFSIQRLQIPNTTLSARSGLGYGYGLGIYQYQKDGHSLYGHGGDADGYLSHFAYSHESGLAYFVMINAFQGKSLRQMRGLLETYIVKNLPKPKYPRRLKLDKYTLGKYSGDYVQVTKRFGSLENNLRELKVFINNGNLYTQEKDAKPKVLFAVNANHFRRSNHSIATMAFIEHEGKIYLQGDIGNFVKLDVLTQ